MQETQPVWQTIQERIDVALAHHQMDTAVPPVVFPGKPTDITYDIELYAHMQQAAQAIPSFDRELLLSESRWSHLPIAGPLLQNVRRALHSIALFYANRTLQHQQTVNWHLWEAVGRLTAVTQQQQRNIEALQAQLAVLNQPDNQ